MRRIGFVFWVAVVAIMLITCDGEDQRALQEASARLNEERLFDFADEHLSEEDLAAAVPDGFEFIDVNRNGFDRHRKKWITAGVQMEGPVEFARAIFYVHLHAASAHREFERQVAAANWAPNWEGDPLGKPWSEARLDVPTFCSAQRDRLFWCHAHKGNVHLVIQSSAGWPSGQDATREERQAADALLTAFGTYLQEEIPEQ